MISIEEESIRMQRKAGQVFSEVDGEVIMLSVENEEYYALNEVGSAIWRILEEPVTAKEIIDLLLERFEIEKDPCQHETMAFLTELNELGLLEVANEQD